MPQTLGLMNDMTYIAPTEELLNVFTAGIAAIHAELNMSLAMNLDRNVNVQLENDEYETHDNEEMLNATTIRKVLCDIALSFNIDFDALSLDMTNI